ncbi:hypothetical protein [Oerskovia flava]|uniref:glycan biosynthesis hexose transferase WsfD n=1 Tax=Oerskovia flava TaxID=2986422 RepID=UPI00224002E8|nr:hypothetical protein [Oerskovia sp. JB1-3-2]
MTTPQTPDVAVETARRPEKSSFDHEVLRAPRRSASSAERRQHARRYPWLPRGGTSALAGRPAVLTFVIATFLAVLGTVRMLLPVAVGLADNGEGRTVACTLGIEPVAEGPRYFTYSILEWTAAAEACSGTTGLHTALLTVVGWLTPTAALDLRVTAVLYCLLVAAAAALVGHLARARRFGRAATTTLVWIVLMDVAFAGYAGSLYPQALAIGGLVLCLVGWLFLDAQGRGRWVGAGAVLVGGAGLVAAGPVMATAAVPLVGLLVWRAVRAVRTAGTSLETRVVPAALALLLVVPAVVGATSATAEQRKHNAWEMVSVGLLADAADPAGELDSMGLPPDAGRFVGIPVWSASSIRGWSGWSDLEIEQGAVLGYMATHPALAYERLDTTVRASASGLPEGLGSYTVDSGNPAGAQEARLTLFSSFQGAFLGFGAPIAALAWGFLLWVALATRRTHGVREPARRLAEAGILALGVAATQVLAVMLTEATDVSRHVVVGSLAGGLALCLVVAAGFATREGAGPTSSAEPAAEPAVGSNGAR